MKNKNYHLLIPKSYETKLDIRETENAIKLIKDYFERELSKQLGLERVSAPLFIRPETGMNDNLNGVERPVSFDVKTINGSVVEIVQSLAKWKRMALKRYAFNGGEGLYTDMNAIRRDEDTDNLHSIYVDQWDWEKIISKEDRQIETLKNTVRKIYQAFLATQEFVFEKYPMIDKLLPTEIFFITTQELENLYPHLTMKEREDAITKEKKAVFLMQIGEKLASGQRHDGRAPDYDDWSLNGDIVFWYPVLGRAVELSSMGIRVDEKALLEQLEKSNCLERKVLPFHKDLLDGKLPYTMGGGIGQSRLCMFFLHKAHIGEVQASIWPEEMLQECAENNMNLL